MARSRKSPRGEDRRAAIAAEKERDRLRRAAEEEWLIDQHQIIRERLDPILSRLPGETKQILAIRASLDALVDQLCESGVIHRPRYNVDRYRQLEKYLGLNSAPPRQPDPAVSTQE